MPRTSLSSPACIASLENFSVVPSIRHARPGGGALKFLGWHENARPGQVGDDPQGAGSSRHEPHLRRICNREEARSRESGHRREARGRDGNGREHRKSAKDGESAASGESDPKDCKSEADTEILDLHLFCSTRSWRISLGKHGSTGKLRFVWPRDESIGCGFDSCHFVCHSRSLGGCQCTIESHAETWAISTSTARLGQSRVSLGVIECEHMSPDQRLTLSEKITQVITFAESDHAYSPVVLLRDNLPLLVVILAVVFLAIILLFKFVLLGSKRKHGMHFSGNDHGQWKVPTVADGDRQAKKTNCCTGEEKLFEDNSFNLLR